jgi:hypothetical protein
MEYEVLPMKRARWPFAICAFSLFLGGCGGSGPSEKVASAACEETRSGYAGDCLALQAPDPKRGFQLHFGPKNYDDAAEVERFLLKPGDEKVTCLYLTTPNTEDVFFSEYHASVRPGTHHMIIWAGPNGSNGAAVPEDGTLTDECRDNLPFLVGVQNGIGPDGARIDVPEKNPVIPPENQGMATIIPARSRAAFQVHYVNNEHEPILRESWANFIYRPKERVTQLVSPIFWIGGIDMNVPANTTQVITAECMNWDPQPRRLVGLTGHMHAHTTRFSAYKIASGTSERKLVYEEFDWSHSHLFFFDSVNKNPEPNAEERTPGAMSGELVLKQGDRIQWECEVHNSSNAALKFADQAYTAEMCNLFGMWTPGMVGAWNCFSK